MFKILIICVCAVASNAVPMSYGGYGTLGELGYGGGLGGYGGGLGGYGGGLGYGSGGAHVNAAIQSHRSIQVIPVASHYGHNEPTVIDVDSSEQPVVLNFNSRSSPLLATQHHIGQPGSHQSSHSVDEPHLLRHEITRPVIQEIRETILPQRTVIQEIKPVIENVQTLVAKGEGKVLGGALVGGLGLKGGYGGGLALGGGYGHGGY